MYAYLGIQNFVASLQAPLAADDVTPRLRFDLAARLCAALANGSHTYLALWCPGAFEIVRARCEQGTIVLDRGQDGTSAQPFPVGACLEWRMLGAAVTDLAGQVMACPLPCTPATIGAGAVAPSGVVGIPYEHRIVISGTPPFSLGQVVIPAWMIVTLDAGEVRLSGTPDAAGTYVVQIPMYSCGNLAPFFIGCIVIDAAAAAGGGGGGGGGS